MMPETYVEFDALARAGELINQYGREMHSICSTAAAARMGLSWEVKSKPQIDYLLRMIMLNLKNYNGLLGQHHAFLTLAREEYIDAEIKNSPPESLIITEPKYNMANEDIMRMVYNADGEYGGDQRSPARRFLTDQDFQGYMRKLLPGRNDRAISDYLARFNEIGCGYMAMANTIIVAYGNKPDEFERTFGYPMYRFDENGKVKYNFDSLAVDLYSSSGNIGKGATNYERKEILERYFENKGLSAAITNERLSVYKIKEALKTAQVILRQKPARLYNMDGTLKVDNDGGHAMTVTRVTNNGNIIVSSWGGQYIVKPSEYTGINRPHINTYQESYLDYELVSF